MTFLNLLKDDFANETYKSVRIHTWVVWLSANILKDKGIYVDDLWNELERDRKQGVRLYTNHTFDNLVFAIDLLFMIDAVNINEDGTIRKMEL